MIEVDFQSEAWKKLTAFDREAFGYALAALACESESGMAVTDVMRRLADFGLAGRFADAAWVAERLALAASCGVIDSVGEERLRFDLDYDVRREVALVGAVGWWTRLVARSGTCDGRYTVFASDHAFLVGDPCFIEVDDVNTPTGTWEGEVTVVGEPTASSGYRRVVAKITDPRVRSDKQHAHYFGHAPTVNYTVYPRNTVTERLFERVAGLKAELQGQRRTAALREEGYKGALAAVCAGQAAKAAEEAYERGLRDAEAAAAKAKEGRPGGT